MFHDGFHSGLLLPWPDPELAFLDPRTDDAPARLPWLELGFGADAWTRLGGGSSVAARLFFGSSAAVLMLRHHPTMEPPQSGDDPPLVVPLQIDQAGWQRLLVHLSAHIDRELSYPRKPGAHDWVIFSSERWSIVNNCHDWTANSLQAIGLDLDYQTWRTSGDFADELAAIRDQLAAGGISVIGPSPEAAQSKR